MHLNAAWALLVAEHHRFHLFMGLPSTLLQLLQAVSELNIIPFWFNAILSLMMLESTGIAFSNPSVWFHRGSPRRGRRSRRIELMKWICNRLLASMANEWITMDDIGAEETVGTYSPCLCVPIAVEAIGTSSWSSRLQKFFFQLNRNFFWGNFHS